MAMCSGESSEVANCAEIFILIGMVSRLRGESVAEHGQQHGLWVAVARIGVYHVRLLKISATEPLRAC